ncbi:uncharacterized protein OCT59_014060 [Rhizophagus irregularis]|uniref:uncharacterized protein n=1 Tax=Rhizophagus irregularis TaxID=588596 RepID=UPI003316B0A1|nr:hypothetical protein OCT59_014060 [Rhizophagus irregularis]
MDSFNQFHGNLVDFWDSTIGINPELAHVAISIPIYPDNENKDDNLNEGKYIQVSDDENKNWEIGKIKFKNNEDECFLSPEWNNDFDFTGQNVHPADDKRAKWSLSTLSESSLESPSFLEYFYNFVVIKNRTKKSDKSFAISLFEDDVEDDDVVDDEIVCDKDFLGSFDEKLNKKLSIFSLSFDDEDSSCSCLKMDDDDDDDVVVVVGLN